MKRTKKRANKSNNLIEIEVTNRSYGKKLIGKKVSFEGYELITDEFGTRPKFVKKDGSFTIGKNILESLDRTLKKFKLVITKEKKSSVKKSNRIYKVYLSDKDYAKMRTFVIAEGADIKNDIVKKTFSQIYPKNFSISGPAFYKSGTIERVVPENCNVSLSVGDKDRVRRLYSTAVLSGLTKKSISAEDIAREKIVFELSTLEAYADDLEKKIKSCKNESEWQEYLRDHILNLKEEYIAKEEHINTSIGTTSLPDFVLISEDAFLDVMEIKTPFTSLVKYDSSHKNYYLSSELMKAIAQTEKYLDQVSVNSLAIEKYLSRKLKLPFGVIRPGGLIVVGAEKELDDQKDPEQAKEDFRRLRNSFKNIKIITYTELLTTLRNRITILKQLQKAPRKKK